MQDFTTRLTVVAGSSTRTLLQKRPMKRPTQPRTRRKTVTGKNDPNMLALARSIAEQLQVTAQQIKQNIIYARMTASMSSDA